jgi:hypothetical protein
MNLYEYCVVRDEKVDKQTGDVIEEAQLVVEPRMVLAKSDVQVGLIAAKAIPDHVIDDGGLDRVRVLIRPF